MISCDIIHSGNNQNSFREEMNEDPIYIVQCDLTEIEEKMKEFTKMYEETKYEPSFQRECKKVCMDLDEEIEKKKALLNMFVTEKEKCLKDIDTSPIRIRCTCFVNQTCQMFDCPFKENVSNNNNNRYLE